VIDHAEDRGVCANAEGERYYDSRGEARRSPESANRAAKILPHCVHAF